MSIQEYKKKLHYCKVFIFKLENIGIEPMTF